MKAKTIWILAILAAFLGSYVYWFEVRPQSRFASTQEAKERATKVFPDLADKAEDRKLIDQVSSISIERKDSALTLDRKGQDWYLTRPVDALASSDSVKSLIGEILTLPKDEKNISKAELSSGGLADYGLDNPSAKLTITVAGKPYEILFGNPDPTDRTVYALMPGSPDVMRVAKYGFEALDKAPRDFRDAHFLRFKATELGSLRMMSSKGEVVLVHKDPDWLLTYPVSDRADSIRVEDLVIKLGAVSAGQPALKSPPIAAKIPTKIRMLVAGPAAAIRISSTGFSGVPRIIATPPIGSSVMLSTGIPNDFATSECATSCAVTHANTRHRNAIAHTAPATPFPAPITPNSPTSTRNVTCTRNSIPKIRPIPNDHLIAHLSRGQARSIRCILSSPPKPASIPT